MGHSEIIRQIKFLVDDAYTQLLCMQGITNPYGNTVKANLPGIRLVNTAEHLHESALAGAVLTAESQDLPGVEVQVYGVNSDHTWEPLCYPDYLEEWRALHTYVPHREDEGIRLGIPSSNLLVTWCSYPDCHW